MPTATYEQLLADTLPACMESDEQYQETGEREARTRPDFRGSSPS